MKYLQLRKSVKSNLFSKLDIAKIFPLENETLINIQLSRFCKKGLICRLKKGLYCFEKEAVDEFVLANYLYQPSYISLETALAYYGMIPDVPQMIISMTPTTSKRIINDFGTFSYSRIDPKMYFGYTLIQSAKEDNYYPIAEREKALLDYIYIRKINTISGLRLDLSNIQYERYNKYKNRFPGWVRKVTINE